MTLDGGILASLARPGARIALADGCGSPRAAYPLLSELARQRGDLRLVTGWLPGPVDGLDLDAFADARTVMPGWGLRRAADAGHVRTVPARLAAMPALLNGPLRPDLLVLAAAPGPVGPVLGAEVSWVRAVIDLGVPVAVVLDPGLPRAAAGPPLPDEQVFVLGEAAGGPHVHATPAPRGEHEAIGRHVADLLADGVRLQWAPGQLGAAVVGGVRAAGVRVHADSGLLGDGVVALDEAGLLLSDPVATYLVGTPELYAWADARGRAGRPVVHRIEHTHDPSRLAAEPPLVAVNTAVEIDLDGQVNVEGTASGLVGGVGGHPDYAAAGARSVRGLSVIALASHHRGRSTRVPQLSRPVSTPSHDVDVVVTEHGPADLRGLDRDERRRALDRIFPG
ncbi:acetyl-CoA hydrolase/transferase C-terminal domain-containing protein [Actinomycetospora cinnamomea]|uniref:Acyl-CoA hydrolase n=1 Tax=Actinomycetospora cinnamomea TaxID=663609 RepID=A0A2U1FIU7_9PSEU|nr:acetyl-CoA hydrolase/transferase C-terminal domain-containing protein [Actinomycetospora cinnamomea]PVZ12087.1 acyl-CoA hydrolase [Actinomycetospora cinnamomea]